MYTLSLQYLNLKYIILLWAIWTRQIRTKFEGALFRHQYLYFYLFIVIYMSKNMKILGLGLKVYYSHTKSSNSWTKLWLKTFGPREYVFAFCFKPPTRARPIKSYRLYLIFSNYSDLYVYFVWIWCFFASGCICFLFMKFISNIFKNVKKIQKKKCYLYISMS
jgi:hypothetical protein